MKGYAALPRFMVFLGLRTDRWRRPIAMQSICKLVAFLFLFFSSFLYPTTFLTITLKRLDTANQILLALHWRPIGTPCSKMLIKMWRGSRGETNVEETNVVK